MPTFCRIAVENQAFACIRTGQSFLVKARLALFRCSGGGSLRTGFQGSCEKAMQD
jgi:hypothetical protein